MNNRTDFASSLPPTWSDALSKQGHHHNGDRAGPLDDRTYCARFAFTNLEL